MSERFDLDGEQWEIGVEAVQARAGTRAIVFHCVTNPQRPYRVVEIPASEAGDGDFEGRAAALFERSQVMDFSHDPDATAIVPHAPAPAPADPPPAPSGSGR